MKIIPYNSKFEKIFVEEYIRFMKEKHKEGWNYENAKYQLLEHAAKDIEQMSIVAIDEKEKPMGAIFAGELPIRMGNSIWINLIIVLPEFKKQGVGNALMKHLMELIDPEIIFDTDRTLKFPRKWYEKLGFKDSGWSTFYIDTKDISKRT